MASTINHISLHTPDMSCEHCVKAIQSRLKDLDGVHTATASLDTQNVDIGYDPAKVSLDTIKSELDDEGYPASE